MGKVKRLIIKYIENKVFINFT